MTTLPLHYDEFRLLAHLCRPVDVRRLPAGFDFGAYLVGLLRPRAPAVAGRLAGLGAAEVAALRAELAEYQWLAT